MKDRLNFRGQTKNGKWIYGSLLWYADEPQIWDKDGNNFIIKPETVGQCTGLKDKNGKWIYEADVLKDSLKDKLYRVAWWGCRAGFEIVEILPKQSTGYTPQTGTMYLTNQSFNRFAVVGNIYDNLELLEEQCANQLNKG